MSKIEELEQRLNRIEQEKAAVRHQLSQAKRKGEAKKKIFFGVAAMKLADQDADLQARLMHYLNLTVKNEKDRALLGLPEQVQA